MLNRWTPKTVLITGGIVMLAAWYLKGRATAAVTETAQAVNPVNRDNVFNRGFNAVYGSVTDGQGTLGTDIADWLADD